MSDTIILLFLHQLS